MGIRQFFGGVVATVALVSVATALPQEPGQQDCGPSGNSTQFTQQNTN